MNNRKGITTMTTAAAAAPVIQINGYTLGTQFPDAQERIRDLELGTRLGFANTYDIRKLIRRVFSKNLSDIHQIATVANRDDGLPSKPATEYWLTEAQALKVIAKSDTAIADRILDEVIAVFVAWRHGRLAPANDNALHAVQNALQGVLQALDSLRRMVDLQREMCEANSKRIGFLEMQLGSNGMISRPRLCELQASVRLISRLETDGEKWSNKRRATADVYRELREVTGWGGKGQPWRELPQQLECKVFPALRNREVDARRLAKAKQTDFPFGSN